MQPARRRLVGRNPGNRGAEPQKPRIPPGKRLRATNAHHGGLHPGYDTVRGGVG